MSLIGDVGCSLHSLKWYTLAVNAIKCVANIQVYNLNIQKIYIYKKKMSKGVFLSFQATYFKIQTDRNLFDRIMCMSWQCYQPHLVVPWGKKKPMCHHVCTCKSRRRASKAQKAFAAWVKDLSLKSDVTATSLMSNTVLYRTDSSLTQKGAEVFGDHEVLRILSLSFTFVHDAIQNWPPRQHPPVKMPVISVIT